MQNLYCILTISVPAVDNTCEYVFCQCLVQHFHINHAHLVMCPVHRCFQTLTNLVWSIFNTHFLKNCTQIICNGTDHSRFFSPLKAGYD